MNSNQKLILGACAAILVVAGIMNACDLTEKNVKRPYSSSGDADQNQDNNKNISGNDPIRAILDSDSDGLADALEMEWGTDINNPDSDSDGLSDGAEVHFFSTNPMDPDTDDGGVNDGVEVSLGTNPKDLPSDDKAIDGSLDSDKDGLTDEKEITLGTNPDDADSDDDGLSDGAEVNTIGTNPLKNDTDEGGIWDSREVATGTLPLQKDDDATYSSDPKSLPVAKEFDQCERFIELNTTTIPALSGSGTCYYKKIVNEMPAQNSSSLVPNLADDVICQNHCPSVVGHPQVVGEDALDLTFLAQRKVSLTGGIVLTRKDLELNPFVVDNFVLVQTISAGVSERALARGTGDVVPSGGLKLNNVVLSDFVALAPGGAAKIGVLDITTDQELNVPTKIRVRMLDAGCVAQTSDVYIVIH